MDHLSSEPVLHEALLQFIFPFAIKPQIIKELRQELKNNGFTHFSLDNKELEDLYYGEGYGVSHEKMERTYLPFAAHILFPQKDEKNGFHRFSRVNNLDCMLEMSSASLPFKVLSTDVILSPFQLGFVTIRIDIEDNELPLSMALEFADRFRTLEDVSPIDEHTLIYSGTRTFEQVEDFLFDELVSTIRPYLDRSDHSGAYFETLPFFVDERMLVQAFFRFEEGVEFDNNLRYKISQLDGMNSEGKPYMSASDSEYIQSYCSKHSYNRRGPDTYYLTTEQTFSCITRTEQKVSVNLVNEMYGEYYYGLLLNIFHKIVLLKLVNMHSRLRIDNDYREIENLIYSINFFSSKFYFMEMFTRSQGREIFFQLREVYGNDTLFEEVRQTLDDLFQYQDKFQSKRRDNLLMILTVYTVISGIYGMNQVIEDLTGRIDWKVILEYSPFQYLALFLTMSGILVSVVLTMREVWRSIRNRWRNKYKQEK